MVKSKYFTNRLGFKSKYFPVFRNVHGNKSKYFKNVLEVLVLHPGTETVYFVLRLHIM